jgi:hypothetical protein
MMDQPLPDFRHGVLFGRVVGRRVTVIPIGAGQASVLFTFYPPLMASAWFIGWCIVGLMGVASSCSSR